MVLIQELSTNKLRSTYIDASATLAFMRSSHRHLSEVGFPSISQAYKFGNMYSFTYPL